MSRFPRSAAPRPPEPGPEADSLEQQLVSLYSDRELLEEELGCSDPEHVVGMVRNLESQLCDLYRTYGHADTPASVEIAPVLAQVREVAGSLDAYFGEREVILELNDGRPALRAVWRQRLGQGDHA